MSVSKSYGVGLCLGLAILAWVLGSYFPLIGGPVFGILIGIGIASSFGGRLALFKEGAAFSGKKLLQLSVILLGFEMNLFQVLEVGAGSLLVMCFTLLTAFLAAWVFARLLRVDWTTATLIGVGTAICGGSAIAATAPVIHAKDKEIAHSISTIFLFNIVAVFVFPALGHFFQMSDVGFGVWAGTAINDTSSVLAAGYAFSPEAGNLATIVKLTRTLMIIPITFGLSIYVARRSSEASRFEIGKAIPWFIGGFILTTVINTSGILPPGWAKSLGTVGKFLIAVAMVGIGLNTHLGQLVRNGMRPILLGLLCWISLATVSLVVQGWLGIM